MLMMLMGLSDPSFTQPPRDGPGDCDHQSARLGLTSSMVSSVAWLVGRGSAGTLVG